MNANISTQNHETQKLSCILAYPLKYHDQRGHAEFYMGIIKTKLVFFNKIKLMDSTSRI
jgi:hypothetical protein